MPDATTKPHTISSPIVLSTPSTESTDSEVHRVTSSIQDEEDFHELIESEKEKHANHAAYGNFSTLVNELHTLLKQQDSDKALSLITRGALGL